MKQARSSVYKQLNAVGEITAIRPPRGPLLETDEESESVRKIDTDNSVVESNSEYLLASAHCPYVQFCIFLRLESEVHNFNIGMNVHFIYIVAKRVPTMPNKSQFINLIDNLSWPQRPHHPLSLDPEKKY